MNINFQLEKQEQHFSVTVFPKIVGNFLQEESFQYKEYIDNLTKKLLLLKKCRLWAFSEQQTCCSYEKTYLIFTAKVNN